MFYNYVIGAYCIINIILAVFILISTKRNLISKFYAAGVSMLILFGIFAYLLSLKPPYFYYLILHILVLFLFAFIPFYFLHLIIVFIGHTNQVQSKRMVASLYLTAGFSFFMLVLGFIPGPVSAGGTLKVNGYIFYLTWMSIIFCLGAAQVFAIYSRQAGRVKPNLIFTGFILLLLIVPGPFTQAIITKLFDDSLQWYFLFSMFAMIVSIYFIFRHKNVLNLYDALGASLAAMNDILVKTDEEFRIEIMKGGLSHMTGYTENELIGKPLNEFVSPGELLIKYRENCIRGDETGDQWELNFIAKDGEKIPISLSLTPIDDNGTPSGYAGIIRDISERIRSEQKINMLYSAVEQSPVSIVIANGNGKILYANQQFTDLSGYDLSEIIDKDIRILKPAGFTDEEFNDAIVEINSGVEWKGEYINKRRDGSVYWESISISTLKDVEGGITHYLIMKEDSSKKKNIEKELRRAKELAEDSDRMKTEFLAQMTHEIRTPLNVILSFSSLLKNETEDRLPKELEPAFASILSSGKRLQRTVELILNMASLQSGSAGITPERTDISELIKEVITGYDSAALEKGLGLSFRRDSSDSNVETDKYIVGQILHNLIDNAIKFTRKGYVYVTLADRGNDRVFISVKDTGIGISKEYLPKLFNKFSQQETGYTRRFEGNGLGLALVKSFADLIGAEISVSSELGKGSEFKIFFNRSFQYRRNVKSKDDTGLEFTQNNRS